jgi:DNA-binding SARP family transcriptional activator/tetratricopeptide (TPR) repeat protein/energy-coupling factor transporter ATP-binding protein EcfA2
LALRLAGRDVEANLPGRKGQLVAYLAVNRDRAVRREELIDALWPVNPPERPEAALATLLTRTRAAIGRRALSGGSYLRLELPSDASIDWEVVQRAADSAREVLSEGDAAAAVAITADALAIIDRGFLPDYEAPWIDERRRDLDERRAPIAEVLARAALALGGEHLRAAEHAARIMIDENPFREDGYRVLMEALVAGGNDAEAMRTYDTLRSLLREQLGLTPSHAVTALAERVLTREREDREGASRGARPTPSVPETHRADSELPAVVAAVAERPLVGREREQRRVLDVAAEVARGRRQVVLLCGESGIGKTRLAVCLASLLHERGWSVLYGRADREIVLSYQPVIEALQQHLANGLTIDPQVQEMLAPELASLSRMIPALRPLAGTYRDCTGTDGELERFRIFEAVAALIGSATARSPVLLILEDLHWADLSTMALLRHVVRTTAGCRLLLLGTFREPDDGAGGPLRDFVDELWHEGLLEQVKLEGLEPAETAELVRSHLPDAPAPLVSRLHERTDGNPFYVEETLRGLDELRPGTPPADFRVPGRVQQMILWRVERLPGRVADVLKAAAVLGPLFDVNLAGAVGSLSAAETFETIETAQRAGMVIADAERPDWYTFRHALIREALYEGTSAGHRARLHLAAGRALERSAPDPSRAAELAMHFSHALHVGGAEDALRWRLAAAGEATLQHAHEEAVEHHRNALAALDVLPADDRRRASVLLGEAQSLIRSGELEQGRERVFEAAELARRVGAIDILAECALSSGSFYLSPGDVQDDVVSLLEEALAQLDANLDPARTARVMARLTVALYWEPGARRRSCELAEESVRLANTAGDTAALAQAFSSRHCAHWVSERPAELLSEAERTIELAQDARDQELELVARTWRLNHLLALARIAEVDEEIERFVGLADRLRQSRCSWYAPLFLGLRSMMGGRLAEAEEQIVKGATLGGQIPGSTSGILAAAQLFFLRFFQGRLGELEDAVAGFVASTPRQPAWRCALALLQSEIGQHERARELIEELAPAAFALIPRDNIWFVAVAMLAEAAARSGADGHAATLQRLLAPYAGLCVVSPDAAWLGPVDRMLGLLSAAQGRHDDALRHLARASAVCEKTHATSVLALARVDHADVLLQRGDTEDEEKARALARAALCSAEPAGMSRVAARALAILSVDGGGRTGRRRTAEEALASG